MSDRYRIRYTVHGIHKESHVARMYDVLMKKGVEGPGRLVTHDPACVRQAAEASDPVSMCFGSPTGQPGTARAIAREIRSRGGQVSIAWVAHVEDPKTRAWSIAAKGSLSIDGTDVPTVAEIQRMSSDAKQAERAAA